MFARVIKFIKGILNGSNYSEEVKYRLFEMVEFNQVEAIKSWINKYPGLIDEKDDKKRTVLYYAVSKRKLEIVKFLLEKKPEMDIIYADNDTGLVLLHYAAILGYLELVKFLLEKNPAMILHKNNDERTALHMAAVRGHLEVVKFLIEQKPDLINAKDRSNETPLHLAASKGNLAVVNFLIEKGADIHVRSSRSYTPLQLTQRYCPGPTGKEIADCLILASLDNPPKSEPNDNTLSLKTIWNKNFVAQIGNLHLNYFPNVKEVGQEKIDEKTITYPLGGNEQMITVIKHLFNPQSFWPMPKPAQQVQVNQESLLSDNIIHIENKMS